MGLMLPFGPTVCRIDVAIAVINKDAVAVIAARLAIDAPTADVEVAVGFEEQHSRPFK